MPELSTPNVQNILVTGATGKQGSALISALRSAGSSFHVLALTRNTSSVKAASLATENHVTVVQGNLDVESSVRKIFEDSKIKGGIWGVFCVLEYPGLGANADGEENQGKTLANLALEYNVSVFVYSSSERGGELFDDSFKLDRLAKIRIERHLRELGNKGLKWTTLRPGFFMENFDGLIGSITVGVLRAGLKPSTKLQLVAAGDAGRVAAGVFQDPDPYAMKILSVVGESLTTEEQNIAFKEATGHNLHAIPTFLGRVLLALNEHSKGLINDIERIHAAREAGSIPEYEQELQASYQANPEMQTFAMWANKRGMISKREKNWNQVSIAKLIAGKL